jgi:hypothetical protein
VKPVSWEDEDKEDNNRNNAGGWKSPKKRSREGRGRNGKRSWLSPTKKAAAEVVVVEEMSDGEVDAAKEAERMHRKRLGELGITPAARPSTSDPDPDATTTTPSSAAAVKPANSGSADFVSAVLHVVILACLLLALGVAAVYVDAKGLWPEVPALPALPHLPESLPELREAGLLNKLTSQF